MTFSPVGRRYATPRSFASGTRTVDDASFLTAMLQVERTPVSADRHSAAADIALNGSFANARAYYGTLRDSVHSPLQAISAAGHLPTDHNYNRPLDQGLLNLVLGTLIAAALPAF